MQVHITKIGAYLTLKLLLYENPIKKKNNKKHAELVCFHPSVLFFITVAL